MLPLKELPLSGVLEVAEDLLFVLKVSSLLVASLSLTLLECALGPECIDLSLSVSSLLLKFSETSDLALLLFLDSLQVGSLFFFAKLFLAVIFNNLLFEVLFLLFALILDLNRTLVGFLDLTHHLGNAFLLVSDNLSLFHLNLIGLSEHLLHLSLTHLLVLNAFELSLLDLVNYDKRAHLLCLLSLHLTLFLELEGLKSFDLHHEVETLLLFNPLLLESLGLVELSVADGDYLRVQHHLVHVLDIIVVLVEHLLGLSKEAICLVLVDDLLLG